LKAHSQWSNRATDRDHPSKGGNLKVVKISALVSKKIAKPEKRFHSWSLSYGATAELDPGEDYTKALRHLDSKLRELLAEMLPTPGVEKKEVKLIVIK